MSDAPRDSLGPEEDLFGGLFYKVTGALLIIESEGGRIFHSNKAAQQLFGTEADELAGRSFDSLITPTARTRGMPLGAEVVGGGGQQVEVEVCLAHIGPAEYP
jgi:PAS domain-containing protein